MVEFTSSGRSPGFRSVEEAAAWYRAWLSDAALPLWASAGVDRTRGGFQELVSAAGEPVEAVRRARVQARQVYVYASAARRGLAGPWLHVAGAGYELFTGRYRQAEGLFVTSADARGEVVDPTPRLYEQDFALLAMAALHVADPSRADVLEDALRLRAAIETFRHPAGGFREAGPQPFQANAHMHLLEAALAWEETGQPGWGDLADEIVDLALARFIDPARPFLREFFAADWTPRPGDDGRRVEPGHQFEWAWLLDCWARRRGAEAVRDVARGLFASGLEGVDRVRGVAVNALSDGLTMTDPAARLWPQTEYLRAALALDHPQEALVAAEGLALYLDTPAPGAWRDQMTAAGAFVDEPSPASSFYHLANACFALAGPRPQVLG